MFGVVIGGALAILFLPQPGGNAADEGSEADGYDIRRRAQERFGPLIRRLRERSSEAFARGQDSYDRAKDDVQRQYDNAKRGEFTSES
jgi:hypothetical protein